MSEGQPGRTGDQPEGSEGQPGGPEGQLGGSEGQSEGNGRAKLLPILQDFIPYPGC